jgi:Protein of unknown function (DUF4012)
MSRTTSKITLAKPAVKSATRRLSLTGDRAVQLTLRVVTGFVLILGACFLYLGLTIGQHMQQGSDELHMAAAMARAPGTLKTVEGQAELRLNLIDARQSFAESSQELNTWSPLIAPLTWVPGVGERVAAVHTAATTAFEATDAAVHLYDGLSPAISLIGSQHTKSPVLARLGPILQAGRVQFAAARVEADRAAASLAGLPSDTGIGSLDHAGSRLRTYVPLLRQASNWLALAPILLGDNHPSRYLFAWENPAELRATGGFIGASDLITVRDGILTHRFAGRVPPPREITSALVPYPEAMYTPESYWIFADSNWSPDFPLSARLERWFYGEDTGLWADGVINFVDTAIPSILQATGPVYLPQYRRYVTSRNVTSLAQHYINGAYKGPVSQGPQDTIRKQFFRSVLQSMMKRLQTLPLRRWPDLARALAGAIKRRDIMFYDRRPQIESSIITAGASGRILSTPRDYLYIVDDNRSYNKINPYVKEDATLSVTALPNLSLDETLILRYHVNSSPASLEGVGPEVGLWGSKHDYQDFLRVYVPSGAVLEHMRGVDPWAPAQAYGYMQFSGRLLVRENHSATVTIRYTVPANVFGGTHMYRLTVQRQPGAHLAWFHIVWQRRNHTQLGAQGSSFFTLPTLTDAHFSRPVSVSIHARPERLPVHSGQADPYVPYRSLSDPRHPL